MTTTAERVRECTTCPPAVDMCAHFGNEITLLTHGGEPCCPCVSAPFHFRVEVIELTGNTCPHGWLCVSIRSINSFPDLPAARAEFDRREAQLLGRPA